jgi:alpha-1,2-mannosyltransferase
MSQERLSTPQRVGVLLLAVAALASGLYFAGKSGTSPETYRNDFNVYYHASCEVIAGRDPYQHSLGDWTPYIYPPLLAELIAPLAILPLAVAAYVWFLISAAAIVAAAWMSASLASDERKPGIPESPSWRRALAACATVFVLRFVLDNFNLGQVNAVVAALAVAHVFFYSRERKALSAVALVLAVSIKLTPALLLVYHIAKLRLKFAIACGALLVAVTAMSLLPFGTHGGDAFETFWSRTVKNEQGYDFAYSGNQSVRGAIARSINRWSEYPTEPSESRRPADLATLLISLALLALAVFAAVRAPSELGAAAPFFCCLVLLSPLSWKAHYVILILPAAYLFSLLKVPGRVRFLAGATLGAAFLLLNLTGTQVIGLAAGEWADAHSLVVAGALLVFIGCVANVLLRKFGKRARLC